jgi:hypothetical protein
VETWTDLYSAFWPQGIAKPPPVRGLMNESPIFAPFASDALRSRNLEALRPLLAARSSISRLRQVRTPVDLLQGRVDRLFDIAQATAAFSRLAGPKKLYVGAFGHIPSPGPEPNVARRYDGGVVYSATACISRSVASRLSESRSICRIRSRESPRRSPTSSSVLASTPASP